MDAGGAAEAAAQRQVERAAVVCRGVRRDGVREERDIHRQPEAESKHDGGDTLPANGVQENGERQREAEREGRHERRVRHERTRIREHQRSRTDRDKREGDDPAESDEAACHGRLRFHQRAVIGSAGARSRRPSTPSGTIVATVSFDGVPASSYERRRPQYAASFGTVTSSTSLSLVAKVVADVAIETERSVGVAIEPRLVVALPSVTTLVPAALNP